MIASGFGYLAKGFVGLLARITGKSQAVVSVALATVTLIAAAGKNMINAGGKAVEA